MALTFKKIKPLVLLILDGFGVSLQTRGNPVAEAHTPTLHEIEQFFPFATLQASGIAVGLPWGEAGNSEVGHLTIGSGRVLYHHLPRIIYSIFDGSFFANKRLRAAADHARKNNSRLHIAGLVSSGSVHSYIDHLYALLEFTKREKLSPVYLHIFTDGKDAPPHEAAKFIKNLEKRISSQYPDVEIASVIGRFYAMDRDEQWRRIQDAYELLVHGAGARVESLSAYLEQSYAKGISDEFIEPALFAKPDAAPGIIQKNDALIFLNFREDSMRELTHAFIDDSFDHFPRAKIPNLFLATMTEYQKELREFAAFPALDISWPLARVLGDAGLRHLHIAETEKYAHITYFFNGGIEDPFLGEERIVIKSLPVTHFDEEPQMRAREITQTALEKLDAFDVIIANLANADMIGHSGNFQAAVQAIEVIDESLNLLVQAVCARDGVMIVTADHGNIELKRSLVSGEKITEHSLNPVPLYIIGERFRRRAPLSSEEILQRKSETSGILTDVAPTIIELLGLKKPAEMTGKSLLNIL